VPTPGLRAVGLLTGRVWPEKMHVAGERAPHDCLVPTIHGRVVMDAVHCLGFNGHRHWIPGCAHDGLHRRDQRTESQGHTVHVHQLHDRPGTPAGVCAQLYISMEDDNACKLPSTRARRRDYIVGTTVNYFLIRFF